MLALPAPKSPNNRFGLEDIVKPVITPLLLILDRLASDYSSAYTYNQPACPMPNTICITSQICPNHSTNFWSVLEKYKIIVL